MNWKIYLEELFERTCVFIEKHLDIKFSGAVGCENAYEVSAELRKYFSLALFANKKLDLPARCCTKKKVACSCNS